jgi:hypothetical protein
MTSPNSLQADTSGVDVTTGSPEPWRLVLDRYPRTFNQYVNDPDTQEWNSEHNGVAYQGHYDAYEQQVPDSQDSNWKATFSDGITRDRGDILMELMEFAIEWRKANNLPTCAFGVTADVQSALLSSAVFKEKAERAHNNRVAAAARRRPAR